MSKNNVTEMAVLKNDARLWSPKGMLRYVIKEIEDNKIKPNKVIVLLLNDEDEIYDHTYYQSNLTMPECILLCEVTKLAIHDDFKE